MKMTSLKIVALVSCIIGSCHTKGMNKRPLIIGHRGASGMYPEHTALAYREAIDQGADYIECDVEVTKDLKLVCSHEPWINEVVDTTQYPQFKDKEKSYVIDDEDEGHDWNDKGNRTGWFIWDFTLDELQTMKRIQPVDYRDKQYDGNQTFCTFEEYIDIAKDKGAGIYPEIKHGHKTDQILYNRDNTLPKEGTMVNLIMKVLEKKGYTSSDSKCFLQSFEKKAIEQLKGRTKLKRNFLMDDNNKEYKELWKDDVLEWAKNNEVTGFGFSKTFIVVPKYFQQSGIDSGLKKYKNVTERFLIDDAHDAGFDVHVFTFRNEDEKLLFDYGQDAYNEYKTFLDLGIDGFFTDFPATANRFLNSVGIERDETEASSLSSGSIAGITIFVIAFAVIVVVVFITKKGKKTEFTSLHGMELPTSDNLKT